jgi:hypothetical protein
MALCLMAATLVACRAAPPPPTRSELLEKLHHCHDELTQGQPAGGVVSACAKLDLSPLNGISRHELAASLGPPTFCVGLSESAPPGGPDCPPQLEPKWSFHSIGGDGLDLYCQTDQTQHCEALRWIRPQ